MRISAVFVSLLMPALAGAQNYPGMSEGDMQHMMQQMQEAQACMQGIDQSRMKAFEQRAKMMESRIKTLCANGERDAAQKEAVVFAREMNGDPDIKKMRECGEKMRGMMPAMPYMEHANASDSSGDHVCDQ